MRISFIVEPFYTNNRIFALNDPVANRDGCQEPFARLRNVLEKRGVRLDTQDICPVTQADAVLFFNAPSRSSRHLQQARSCKIPIHVLALESEHIHLPNGDLEFLDSCQTVFTYRDDLVDGERYLQIRYPQKLREPRFAPWSGRRFACMLSGNKWSNHPAQLYGARLQVIEWYERNAPDRFDLYGPQWNMPLPKNLLMKASRRIPGLRSLFTPKFQVWCGVASNKEEIISRYRFCYCFENFSRPSGWITEKIFDAMFGGAVPIYWGPPNVKSLIPQECFINAAEFDSIADLDRFLLAKRDEDCIEYIEMARSFLNSSEAHVFSIDQFVGVIANRLA